MDLQVGNIYQGEIVDFTHDGNGVLKLDNRVVFVDGGLIGDIVKIKINEIKKNTAMGEILETINYSKDRVEYFFNLDGLPGGVPLINYAYDKQLEWKREKIKNDFRKIGNIGIDVKPTIGMHYPFRYRNHTQVPVAKVDGKIETGYFKQKTNEIVPIEEDYLQAEIGDRVLESIKKWMEDYGVKAYDRKSKTGVVKHIGIRTNENQQAMVILVTAFSKIPHSYELVHRLIKEAPGVISVFQNVNPEDGSYTYGKDYNHIFGKETLKDYIGDLMFEISPNSFFQVNREQTKILYSLAREYLNGKADDIVFDIFCGIGTISLFISDSVKEVIGIESVKQAVLDAESNAKLNNIDNASFRYGKAEELFPKIINEGKLPNKLVLDPPRKGCDKVLLDEILKHDIERIVYISCNPSTLARDVKILIEGGYKVKEVQPVDMFPHSAHIECVVLMSKKEQ